MLAYGRFYFVCVMSLCSEVFLLPNGTLNHFGTPNSLKRGTNRPKHVEVKVGDKFCTRGMSACPSTQAKSKMLQTLTTSGMSVYCADTGKTPGTQFSERDNWGQHEWGHCKCRVV